MATAVAFVVPPAAAVADELTLGPLFTECDRWTLTGAGGNSRSDSIKRLCRLMMYSRSW